MRETERGEQSDRENAVEGGRCTKLRQGGMELVSVEMKRERNGVERETQID